MWPPRRNSLFFAHCFWILVSALFWSSHGYDISLGPNTTNFSSEEVQRQRAAGLQLTEDFEAALEAGNSSFEIQSGVYRLPRTWVIENVTDFHISAPDVELITEGGLNHINIFASTDISITGPLGLDGSPFGFTQAIVRGTDNASYILLELMPGYPTPDRPQRLMFFTPDGVLLPFYQVPAASYELVSDGLYKAYMPSYFWNQWAKERANCIQTGNLVSIELLGESSGIFIKGNNGIYLSKIAMYTQGLLFGQDETGPVMVDEWKAIRKPGTNRLGTGGFMAISFKGGSFEMNNSELCCHFDDLTDVQSSIWYAYNQTAPRKVYLANLNDLQPGATMNFYNLSSLRYDGTARLIRIDPVNDTELIEQFRSKLDSMGLLTQNASLSLAVLDSDVNLTSQIEIVDIEEYRPSEISFRNSYFYEGMASAINPKGAKSIIIQNNTVSRVGYRGASVGFDPYWWEGGIPANITIEGNTIIDTPYGVATSGGSISTYVDSTASLLANANHSVIRNITVKNNVIKYPPVAGIELSYVNQATVENNLIINPMSRLADDFTNISLPFQDASAIYLDVVSGHVQINNNAVIVSKPALTPQVIRAANGTNISSLTLCSNTVIFEKVQKSLPTEIWSDVMVDASLNSQRASGTKIQIKGTSNPVQYTTSGGRQGNSFTLLQVYYNSSVSFSFRGTSVQVYGCIGPMYSLANFSLDGAESTSVDTSLLTVGDINYDPEIGFCQQLLFSLSGLANSTHNLTIFSPPSPGQNSLSSSGGIALSSFSFLKGHDQCGQTQNQILPAPSPILALSPYLQANIPPVPSTNVSSQQVSMFGPLEDAVFRTLG